MILEPISHRDSIRALRFVSEARVFLVRVAVLPRGLHFSLM